MPRPAFGAWRGRRDIAWLGNAFINVTAILREFLMIASEVQDPGFKSPFAAVREPDCNSGAGCKPAVQFRAAVAGGSG
jgi:hypothetical protein